MARHVVALAMAALVACTAPSASRLTQDRAAAIEDSVRSLLDRYVDLVAAGDWAALGELYADDVRFHWVEDGEVRYGSVGEVRDAIGSLGGTLEAQGFSGARLELDDVRVLALAPGVAHATAGFEQRFVRSEGDPFSFSGTLTSVAVRADEGWRFLAGHTSTPSQSEPGGGAAEAGYAVGAAEAGYGVGAAEAGYGVGAANAGYGGAPEQEQEAPPPGCPEPEHRQFDFWIGEWDVRNPQGQVVGHNTITRVADGCGLLEQWRAARGGSGVSINMYEPDRGEWTQTWVGTSSRLRISGGLEGGRMVMTGDAPRETPDGPVLDRITWTPLEDGRVRQVWEVSPDDGSTWRTIFVGLYSPTEAGGG